MKNRNRFIHKKSELRLWVEDILGLLLLIIVLVAMWLLLALIAI
jgi:hypothetical protein